MNDDLVSVIIPVYNKESYLKDCFNSIIQQTWNRLEVLIVDDGSTDNSLNIVKEYADKDSRFKVIKAEHKGPSVARNTGIDAASGKYLTFVDADDYVEPDYIRNLVCAIGDADLCISGCKQWDADHNKWVTSKYASARHNLAELGNSITQYEDILYAVMWRLYHRKIVIEHDIRFPEDMQYGEDTIFFFKYLFFIQKIVILNDAQYVHRRQDKNSLEKIAWKRIELQEKLLSALEELSKILKDNKVNETSNNMLYLIEYWQIINMWNIGISICYQIDGYRNRRKKFYSIVKEYSLKGKSRNMVVASKRMLIIKATLLTNTFFPIYLLIKTAGMIKRWDRLFLA